MLLSGPPDHHLAMKWDPSVQGSVKASWWVFSQEAGVFFPFFLNTLLLQQGH